MNEYCRRKSNHSKTITRELEFKVTIIIRDKEKHINKSGRYNN